MSNDDETNAPPCCGQTLPTSPWGPLGGRTVGEQVAYSSRSGGFAYRPRCFVCLDEDSREAAIRYLETREELSSRFEHTPVSGTEVEQFPTETLFTFDRDVDVEYLVDELRDLGVACELNYVVFGDSSPSGACGCQCGFGGDPVYGSPVYGSPVYGSPVYGSPVYGSAASGGGQFARPVYASPVYGSPVYGSPVYGSPVYGSGYKSEGLRSNTARPVSAPARTTYSLPNTTPLRVIVLDTGIAKPEWRPPWLGVANHECGDCCYDPPDHDGDTWLDPASGHGTFIAGVIEQLAPEQDLWSRRVLTSFGDGDIIRDIVPMLYCLLHRGALGPDTVLNLSFGGYADREMRSLARAIRRVQRTGAVVVSSAGNDATCRPTYPACLPGVVAVGALDDLGPAPFTNHGAWVRACAPGTDLVSAFYRNNQSHPLPELELPVPAMPGSGAPTEYLGWARWSGTSFAAPVVTAALIRHMALTSSTAEQAVEAVIDAPGLYRIPGLGTVVNLVTPTPDEVHGSPPP